MKSLLLKLGAAAGIDSAILNIISARLWSLLAGPISIFLIAHRLSPEEQGYYYTFGSVLSARVFLELGLLYVVLQFASHEMSGLRWDGNRLVGDAARHARLADLLRKSVRWYSIASLLVVALLLPAGMWFLGIKHTQAPAVGWQGPWIVLAIVSALSLSIIPITGIIEGCGRVAEVTAVRMREGMAMGIGLWIGLLSGCGLYSLVISSVGGLLVTSIWLLATKRHFITDLWLDSAPSTLSWWDEIAPMQWRTAVVWVSSYFAYQFFTPAIFAAHGADLAGQVGMTLNLITVIGALSLAWIQTKAAPFGQLVAQRDWAALDALYHRTLYQSVTVFALGCTGLASVVMLLRWWHHPIANRVLDLPNTLIFMAAAGLNHIVFCRGIYLRAHKDEPFYGLQLVNGLIVGAILLFIAPRYGLLAVSTTYLLGACLPVLLCSGAIFRKYRQKHHTSPDVPGI